MIKMEFECKMCGECCRNIRGRTHKKLPKLPPYVFMAIPPSLTTIGLFEWEVPILKTDAKRLSIPLYIKPHAMIWDQKSKKAIVTMWNLDHDNCPFLSEEDNKCRIYRDRPLVCQTYPLFAIGILKDPGKLRRIGLADCPNAVKLPFPEGQPILVRPSTIFNTLFKVYGSTFLGALRHDVALILLSKYSEEALSQGILRPATIKKKIIKAILRSKPTGLFEFLQSKGVINKKEIRKEIQSIYDLTMTNLKQIISGDMRDN